MRHSQSHLTAIVLSGLLLGGLWATVPVTGAAVSSDDGGWEPGATTTMQDTETPVEAEVDCNRSRVVLTAPEDYRYDVTVAVANLTPATNDVSRSTLGSVEGNETVEFDGGGIVFVFVDGRSDDAELVATDVTNCPTDLGESNATVKEDDESTTTVRSDDAEPAIRIDCVENDVRFTAPEGTAYVAKVVSVAVSPTSTSTSSTTRTLDGNATVSVDDEALVAAFVSTGDLGDDRTVSMIRNCTPYGPETVSNNETDVENRDDDIGNR